MNEIHRTYEELMEEKLLKESIIDQAQAHYSKTYPLTCVWKVIFKSEDYPEVTAVLVVFKDLTGTSGYEEMASRSEEISNEKEAVEDLLWKLRCEYDKVKILPRVSTPDDEGTGGGDMVASGQWKSNHGPERIS